MNLATTRCFSPGNNDSENVVPGAVIVVTGASSGIGRELALQMAAPGVELWLIGRDEARLDEVSALVAARGAHPRVAVMDLSDIENAGHFLDDCFPEGKRVDEIYLAAAVTLFGEVKDTFASDWQLAYQTNLLSPVQWAVHFYKGMVAAGAGRIVIISSLAAYAGYPTAAGYATMKAGLLGLYRSLVHEGKFHHVNIHIASPGYVDTNIYKRAIYRNTTYEKVMEQIQALGFRVLSASDTAAIILAKVRRGKRQFAMPFYASFFKLIATRCPAVIDLIHNKILKSFRQTS
jgi:short-subunit dehydrogenase